MIGGLEQNDQAQARGCGGERGDAIQAINKMILGLGGEDTIAKIEAAPWSARMRESGEPDLVRLEKSVRGDIGKEPQ